MCRVYHEGPLYHCLINSRTISKHIRENGVTVGVLIIFDLLKIQVMYTLVMSLAIVRKIKGASVTFALG
jgi:hypothetical protein